MNSIKTDHVLDAKNLSCPMPIVKTKKAMNDIQPGQVLEIQATDKGSTADLKAWSENTGNQYLGTIEEGAIIRHYLRKSADEELVETKHPIVINNEELLTKINTAEDIVILDVREPSEFVFNHIPGSVSIPFGELASRIHEVNEDDDIYVICRTGSRSDLAAQQLTKKGFKEVTNVVPGMSTWKGETTKLI
ncbi:sulfurtransferase TusA family protein [Cytobacillus sp. Hm23]